MKKVTLLVALVAILAVVLPAAANGGAVGGGGGVAAGDFGTGDARRQVGCRMARAPRIPTSPCASGSASSI